MANKSDSEGTYQLLPLFVFGHLVNQLQLLFAISYNRVKPQTRPWRKKSSKVSHARTTARQLHAGTASHGSTVSTAAEFVWHVSDLSSFLRH